MSSPSLTIVTPWLDHEELAADYWNALKILGPNDHVCVIDNGSNPPLTFSDIRLEHNEGVHFAYNLGLRTAITDAVLFLNNDIVMEDDGWLEKIRAALNPGVVVGADLRSERHAMVDGEIHPYLDGWCIAGMRDDLLPLNGWDETLEEPAYFGDNIFSLRARAAGLKLLAVQVGLRHLGSVTSRESLDWEHVANTTMRNKHVYEHEVRLARQPEPATT